MRNWKRRDDPYEAILGQGRDSVKEPAGRVAASVHQCGGGFASILPAEVAIKLNCLKTYWWLLNSLVRAIGGRTTLVIDTF